ncbi:hypothetical protein [Stappia indica]|uniref:hypothetical protein n=1 Tax=Stappia indica TaxID=538381 RepID=UPI0011125520|nr:hypothetical protein [Stappia indica]
MDTLPFEYSARRGDASLWEGCFSADGLEGTLVAPETGYNRMMLSIFVVFWEKKPKRQGMREFHRHNWQV